MKNFKHLFEFENFLCVTKSLTWSCSEYFLSLLSMSAGSAVVSFLQNCVSYLCLSYYPYFFSTDWFLSIRLRCTFVLFSLYLSCFVSLSFLDLYVPSCHQIWKKIDHYVFKCFFVYLSHPSGTLVTACSLGHWGSTNSFPAFPPSSLYLLVWIIFINFFEFTDIFFFFRD